jgi:alcohol dehydrogenase YqhD (iron-dependent ADH family)
MNHNFLVVRNGNLFGVNDEDKKIVPIQHLTIRSAVDEFIFFHKLNIKEKFLDYDLTIEQIDDISNKLMNTIIY